MITIEKLKIYSKYNGDGDMWARRSLQREKILHDKDWGIIDGLIQDLTIAKNGYASKEFITSTDTKLKENFDNNDSVDFLKSLVK